MCTAASPFIYTSTQLLKASESLPGGLGYLAIFQQKGLQLLDRQIPDAFASDSTYLLPHFPAPRALQFLSRA
jgi:hypothetical protein